MCLADTQLNRNSHFKQLIIFGILAYILNNKQLIISGILAYI